MFRQNNKARMDSEAIPLFPLEFQHMIFGENIINSKYTNPLRNESKVYFENIVKGHDKVKGLFELSEDYYLVKRIKGKDIKVLVNNIYTLGLADYYEIANTYDAVDAIVIMSNWNGYTTQAKSIAKKENRAIMGFKEFLGALNYDNIIEYINEDNKGNAKYSSEKGFQY